MVRSSFENKLSSIFDDFSVFLFLFNFNSSLSFDSESQVTIFNKLFVIVIIKASKGVAKSVEFGLIFLSDFG